MTNDEIRLLNDAYNAARYSKTPPDYAIVQCPTCKRVFEISANKKNEVCEHLFNLSQGDLSYQWPIT